MIARLFFSLPLIFLVAICDAEAGRRGLRIDLGAWNTQQPISLGGGSGACPEAAYDISIPIPGPGPSLGFGWVSWQDLQFMTSAFEGLDTFYCQTSKPYQQGASTDEYLNEGIFPADEEDLAAMIGANTNNAVTAIRYTFVNDPSSPTYGRQWTFYFFPDGLTVVALHGVLDNQVTYEWIFDHEASAYVFQAQFDFWDGGYFCFDGREYQGDCVPPAPQPPDEFFLDSFE